MALAGTVPATTVPETRLGPLFAHELRWARVIAAQVPVQFALSAIQYPLALAVVCLAASGGARWAVWLVLAALGDPGGGWARHRPRAGRHAGERPACRARRRLPIPLLPLRDLLSVLVVGASYLSDGCIGGAR